MLLDLKPFVAALTGNVDLPATGKLTSDAHLTIVEDQGLPVTVTVAADATNISPADLVADVNTAAWPRPT